MPAPTPRHRPTAALLLRLLAAVPGGYALTASLGALLGGALPLLGMPRSEAVVLAAMLGFVVYLLWLLWAFSVRSLARLWAVVAAGILLALGLLWLLR